MGLIVGMFKVHVRQGDESFDAWEFVKQVLKWVSLMDDFAIYVMSDSKEYRKNITIQLQKLGKTVVSDLQSDEIFMPSFGKDYAE